jgi:nitroimidazol reductase NimA-like FMN-containing flavoprotein (pyridoxamine 5'-phosphate oxidase superfamily)
MFDADTQEFLASRSWGVLSTVGPEGPYGVPVAYVVHEGEIWFACGPGQKLRYLRDDPAVCMTVTQVEGAHDWRSVVVRGRVEWVEEAEVRLRILRSLLARSGGRPTLDDLARAARGSVCRIRTAEASRRARGRLAA